ncbi:MAG: glycosyl transferase family 2 [Clostridia bacterium]|nr:glycosyl transferase family 2 [Clostridia bacterium]
MDARLQDVLSYKEGSYVFPFFWQRGDHTEKIPAQIEAIYQSGCREFCVESKTHPDFCGAGWWRDLDLILEEAEKRNMRVWILDDDRFPTGHAAGMIEKKYPHLRQWNATERHIDVAGPTRETAFIAKEMRGGEETLLGVYAYKRLPDENETCQYEAIDLTDKVQGDYLYWDVPEGVWRVFFYYQSRVGGWNYQIDMISKESVAVLLESVYEPHYQRYKDRFGKTIVGFFSDEPAFVNQMFEQPRIDYGFYEKRIGTKGLALPWNENVRTRMTEELGFDPVPHLNLLWFEDCAKGDQQAAIRYAYMNAVTALYRDCFTKQLGDWCRERGVLYTGHVIEDMGSHCHLHHSAGHYFRSMMGQDISGVDIVMQQMMPGMARYFHTASAQGLADGEFFHYVLAKMGASMAHLYPQMQGRAMCEMFGAYGQSLDTTMMKYITDSMLVRGINHFVPHAFSARYPDYEFPPHFYDDGHNPSFEGFSCLMRYLNRAAHLLSDTRHVANAAVLYNAAGEWSSRYREASPMQPIVTRLYDAHIDYDIVPMDFLGDARVENGKLLIHKEQFDCFIVPHADHLPEALQQNLKRFHEAGLPVWFFGGLPENAIFQGTTMNPEDLIPTMRTQGMTDVEVSGDYPDLRVYHGVRDGQDVYMFFNEDPNHCVDTTMVLPSKGTYARIDLMGESYTAGKTEDGHFTLSLKPNQSIIVIFGDTGDLPAAYDLPQGTALEPTFRLSLAESDDLTDFKEIGVYDHFFNVTGKEGKPDFSGKMKYEFTFQVDGKDQRVFLDLGHVGQNAALAVNGKMLGMRIASPYLFEITDAVIAGENHAEVVVSNTLAQKMPEEYYTRFIPLAPSGLLGGMQLILMEKGGA